MNPALTTGAAVLTLAALLALTHVPLGTWVHRVFTDEKDWRVERLVYRLVGVDPRTEQRWTGYAVSVVAFSVVSVVGLFLLIEVQGRLPWSLGRSMDWHTAINTAVSFTSNTNWQSYAGEAGAGYTVQSVGLTVQNFVSAAVGLAVAIALIRGIARQTTDRLGNFWVDLVRGIVRILLPLAVVAAVVLLVGGVIQNLTEPTSITTITGAHQVVQGGPVASQEAIKELGTNGGGFFNANSAHPFENPNAWTNLVRDLPAARHPLLPAPRLRPDGGQPPPGPGRHRDHGRPPRHRKPGAGGVGGVLRRRGAAGLTWRARSSASASPGRRLFAGATTGTSTGAVNSMHDSFSALGGGGAPVEHDARRGRRPAGWAPGSTTFSSTSCSPCSSPG